MGQSIQMTAYPPEDPHLNRLTRICLALPEAAREFTGQHARFLIGTKKFAYYLVDHHGDGIVALSFRAPLGVNDALIASDPDRFYRAVYTGHLGWVCLRLDRETIDWAEVEEFVTDSYRLAAPKRLAAMLPARPWAPAASPVE